MVVFAVRKERQRVQRKDVSVCRKGIVRIVVQLNANSVHLQKERHCVQMMVHASVCRKGMIRILVITIVSPVHLLKERQYVPRVEVVSVHRREIQRHVITIHVNPVPQRKEMRSVMKIAVGVQRTVQRRLAYPMKPVSCVHLRKVLPIAMRMRGSVTAVVNHRVIS